MHLPLYLKLSSIEVQIVPLEGADLTTAQAGGQLQQEQFKASILFGLDEQPLISSGASTCISLALAEGRRQKSEGFLEMIFSETALSSAAWKVVWMPRTVWSESPSPYCS